MSPNKSIMKIYSITNLIVFLSVSCVSTFLYNFSQSLSCLTSRTVQRLYSLVDGGSTERKRRLIEVSRG
jgi:hypothetical protein